MKLDSNYHPMGENNLGARLIVKQFILLQKLVKILDGEVVSNHLSCLP